jgi:hypothetical protein
VGTFAGGSLSAMLWDESADDLQVLGGAAGAFGLTVGGTQRLHVSATGIDVTGTVVADGLTVAGTLSFTGGGVQFPTQLSNSFTPNAESTDLLLLQTRHQTMRFASEALPLMRVSLFKVHATTIAP